MATAAPELISVAEKEHLAVDCLTKRLRLLATLKPMGALFNSHAQVLSLRVNADWWLSQQMDK